jgi:hypothetical protein
MFVVLKVSVQLSNFTMAEFSLDIVHCLNKNEYDLSEAVSASITFNAW